MIVTIYEKLKDDEWQRELVQDYFANNVGCTGIGIKFAPQENYNNKSSAASHRILRKAIDECKMKFSRAMKGAFGSYVRTTLHGDDEKKRSIDFSTSVHGRIVNAYWLFESQQSKDMNRDDLQGHELKKKITDVVHAAIESSMPLDVLMQKITDSHAGTLIYSHKSIALHVIILYTPHIFAIPSIYNAHYYLYIVCVTSCI